mmetsp:Transcript_10585/g.25987  ORF Transcript_10585/g.25987 Transcript_10585/m.25987 type:complete len:208 (-) Transcript_10585:149-772(-)
MSELLSAHAARLDDVEVGVVLLRQSPHVADHRPRLELESPRRPHAPHDHVLDVLVVHDKLLQGGHLLEVEVNPEVLREDLALLVLVEGPVQVPPVEPPGALARLHAGVRAHERQGPVGQLLLVLSVLLRAVEDVYVEVLVQDDAVVGQVDRRRCLRAGGPRLARHPQVHLPPKAHDPHDRPELLVEQRHTPQSHAQELHGPVGHPAP